MEQYLIPIGLILNSTLITVDRFFVKIPGWLYMSGLICGIGLLIAGAYLTKMA